MKSTGITSIGLVRKNNQDAFFRSDTSVGILDNLYIVADGVGGQRAGEVASAHAIDYYVDVIKTDKETEIQALMATALKLANARVLEESKTDESLNGMCTTLVGCSISDGYLHVVNVGDSRLYVYKDKLEQFTLDHSLVEELFRAGIIDEKEMKDHPDRNMITRAVGSEGNLKVDYFKTEIKDIKYVLLCSDGLTKMMDDERIAEYFCDITDLDATAQAMVDEANARGGKDNTTVVIVDLSGEK